MPVEIYITQGNSAIDLLAILQGPGSSDNLIHFYEMFDGEALELFSILSTIESSTNKSQPHSIRTLKLLSYR